MDELIRRYAESAEHIYDARTAGDYTWLGIFAEFAQKVLDQQVLDGED